VAVIVSREIFDPVGAGSTAGGGEIQENAPQVNPWQPRPFTTKTEYIVSEAMRLMQVPAEQIRMVRPPFISEPFPPQLGYGPQLALTIEQVLETDRWTPQIRSWISGTPRQIRHVDQVEDQWSGTLRGFSASPNQGG
jgi:hypothetical protein